MNLEPIDRLFIIKNLINKNCLNCANGLCNIEYSEKVGYDEFNHEQGSNCLGWSNDEIIGKCKVLKIYDAKKIDKVKMRYLWYKK